MARKKKEARHRDRKHLTGNAARELYLECLQLLLRKQVLWLVRKKGFHPELEAVVRDLWLLRVRAFPGLEGDRQPGKGGDRKGDGGLIMFSSQARTPSEEAEGGGEESDGDGEGFWWKRKRKSWARDVWPLPGVLDTLALVYLGCVLRQEPVRLADVFRWAKDGQMPFLGAVSETEPNAGKSCVLWLLTAVLGQPCASGVAGPTTRLGASFSANKICKVPWR